MTSKIIRINQIAKEKPDEVFTSIYHLINKELLLQCFEKLDGNKARGMDMVTKDIYYMNLDENINNLVKRLKNKSYKPQPARKVKIPKGNGKIRELAISNFEDKIVQLALKSIIEAIYEPKFSNNMYGFRPNRGCHNALRQISKDIEWNFTNYVVEADIKGYFDNINHENLIKCLELHIKDKNIIMLTRKLLKAGILESNNLYIGDDGTPQGSILSPVLANIYMYYVLIRWFDEIVKPNCHGFASIINYADDFICCFQRKQDALVFYKKWLPERLARAKLELAQDKTRIISFGKFAKENCKGKKAQTFEFLGFVHYCSTSRNGKFRIKRKTAGKKFNKKIVEFNEWCNRNRDLAIDDLMDTYKKKMIGHFNYYGITDNYYMIQKYKFRTMQILFKWLNRRSQRKSYTWEEFNKLLEQYKVPKPRICVKIYGD